MPTTEKLKQEIADAEKKLAQERSRLQRLENRKSYYEKGERQKRTHRLITRGAAVDSMLPRSNAVQGNPLLRPLLTDPAKSCTASITGRTATTPGKAV